VDHYFKNVEDINLRVNMAFAKNIRPDFAQESLFLKSQLSRHLGLFNMSKTVLQPFVDVST